MDKIAVISGRHPITGFASSTNHRIYCDRNNLTYIHCNWPTKAKNPYLNKLHYIYEYIDYFNYVFWIDDDAFFLDPEQDLRTILPKGDSFLSICESPSFKSLKTYFSAGQFALKCDETGKAFLRKAMSTDMTVVKNWWNEDLGYFSNGDQDILTYLAHTEAFRNGITIHDYKAFNSRFENLKSLDPHSIFILHFTGKRSRKWRHYKQAASILNTDASLLNKAYSKEYSMGRPKWPAKFRTMLEMLRS